MKALDFIFGVILVAAFAGVLSFTVYLVYANSRGMDVRLNFKPRDKYRRKIQARQHEVQERQADLAMAELDEKLAQVQARAALKRGDEEL